MTKKKIKELAIKQEVQECLKYCEDEKLNTFNDLLDFWWVSDEKFYWVAGSGEGYTGDNKKAKREFQIEINIENGIADWHEI